MVKIRFKKSIRKRFDLITELAYFSIINIFTGFLFHIGWYLLGLFIGGNGR